MSHKVLKLCPQKRLHFKSVLSWKWIFYTSLSVHKTGTCRTPKP